MYRVFPGFVEPLSCVAGHRAVEGIERYSLLKADMVPGTSFHVAAHVVGAEMQPADSFRYTQAHSHDFDELNILVSEDSTLTYLYEVDGEKFTVSSPATVHIPAGSLHRMEAVSGTGVFLCVRLDAASEPRDG